MKVTLPPTQAMLKKLLFLKGVHPEASPGTLSWYLDPDGREGITEATVRNWLVMENVTKALSTVGAQ